MYNNNNHRLSTIITIIRRRRRRARTRNPRHSPSHSRITLVDEVYCCMSATPVVVTTTSLAR